VCGADPVWKGWLTLRTAIGDSNLELVDGEAAPAGRLAGEGAAAAARPLAAPTVQLTLERLQDLQLEVRAKRMVRAKGGPCASQGARRAWPLESACASASVRARVDWSRSVS
jgi:hypothetical protein